MWARASATQWCASVFAGLAYWLCSSLPSWLKEFDSPTPLQFWRPPLGRRPPLFLVRARCWLGAIAQMEEHLPCKQGAVGSIPTGSTKPDAICAVPVR